MLSDDYMSNLTILGSRSRTSWMLAKRVFFPKLCIGLAVAVLLLTLGLSPAGAQKLVGPRHWPIPLGVAEEIPGQYIVRLKRSVGRDAFINLNRLKTFRRYTIINGFAARMSQRRANRLRRHPRVESITPDLIVRTFGEVPTGVQRIGQCLGWPLRSCS